MIDEGLHGVVILMGSRISCALRLLFTPMKHNSIIERSLDVIPDGMS